MFICRLNAIKKFREFKQINEFIHLSHYPVFLMSCQTFHISIESTPVGNKKKSGTIISLRKSFCAVSSLNFLITPNILKKTFKYKKKKQSEQFQVVTISDCYITKLLK